MISPHATWNDFRKAFCDTLDTIDRTHLLEAWENGANKTAFYEHKFMSIVAERLGCSLAIEYLRADYTFFTADHIPLVFAEAENAHGSAGHEIKNLCSVAAPLKVLILSCSWQDSERDRFLPEWVNVIRMRHQAILMDCCYGIIVGEWHDTDRCFIEYSFTLIDTDGTVHPQHLHPILR